MSKNLNSVFRDLPAPSVPRSVQNLSHSVTTSMNVGYLYPINWEEVLPGDTFNLKETQVSRLTSTFIKPVMDNLYMDVYHFYVPYTQIFENAKDIFAVANPSQYVEEEYAVMPSTYGTVSSGSIGDYLGLPLVNIANNDGCRVSLAPFRAFAHIYNNWFRNENVTDEVYLNTGEKVDSETLNSNAWSNNNYCGRPPRVNKYKDYFTSALPSPQKGTASVIFGNNPEGLIDGVVPVKTYSTPTTSNLGSNPLLYGSLQGATESNVFYDILATQNGSTSNYRTVRGLSASGALGTAYSMYPVNLGIDQSNLQVSLNDLRFAEAYQHELELNAMYGSRYNEYLLSHYGIYSDDLEIGIPQYLGGSRTPINITQVAQTTNGNLDSEGMTDSPLGQVGAYSWTVGDSLFRKRFKYHGIVMTVACMRYRHTYQQGIASKWHKLAKDDFYNPSFAYIGMQPIYKKELYAINLDSANENQIFGYKPAWNEYRFSFNTITGQARSNIDNSLDRWHFADDYDTSPVLSDEFVKETNIYFNRTITIEDSENAQNNFILNFYFDIKAKRPITDFSMPSINVRRW